ncbi:unnamed protein product [Rhizopus stolonifer]
MATYTPVIRLPKPKPNTAVRQYEIFEPNDCLVSDTLFLGKLPKNVRESDIRTLLQHCMPTEIIMDREKDTGELIFSHKRYADRAYSLYNGFTFTNAAKLELQMYRDRRLDEEANANLLEVNGLPEYFDDNKLYDIFRPFGPLYLCKCVMIDGLFKGNGFIQFFRQNNSDEAQNNLDGRLLDGCKLSVITYLPLKPNPMHQQKERTIPEDNLTVDTMNLYIKNLDPKITNNDLENLFREFGRIVSARVMTNSATEQSKGYGFVSFSKPEEAATALHEMNGYIVNDRPLIVAYHEPKKGKSNNQPQQRQHRPNSLYPQSYVEQQNAYRPNNANGLGINHVDEIGMNGNVNDLSVGQKTMHRKPLEPYSSMITSTPKLLSELAFGPGIQHIPSNYAQTESSRTYGRRGSFESVMTESTASIQRTKLEAAVDDCGNYGELTEEIVDMLLTLKRKERSICLFNRDYLKEKIDAALEALAACEEEEEPVSKPLPSPPIPQNQRKNRKSTAPVYEIVDNIVPQSKSKAIPIIAPPSASSASSSSASNQNKVNADANDVNDEVNALMTSFEGKPIHEKKQLLGDMLFPLVKATGTRQAPKVTIRLLDTVDLYELAKIMFDTPLLESRVKETFNSL